MLNERPGSGFLFTRQLVIKAVRSVAEAYRLELSGKANASSVVMIETAGQFRRGAEGRCPGLVTPDGTSARRPHLSLSSEWA